jgi:hypothetical protein
MDPLIPCFASFDQMRRTRIAATILSLLFGFIFAGRAHASPDADFWRWFAGNEAMLFDFERDQERVFDLLAAEMHKVDARLTFEFGPKENGRRQFVISADGIREAFPKVERLFAQAPALARWQFVKFRPRRAPFDIGYGGILVKASAVSFALELGREKPGIVLFIPGYAAGAREQAYKVIAYLLLDQALGEHDLETRVGNIEVRAPVPGRNAQPLVQLPAAFDEYFVAPKK